MRSTRWGDEVDEARGGLAAAVSVPPQELLDVHREELRAREQQGVNVEDRARRVDHRGDPVGAQRPQGDGLAARERGHELRGAGHHQQGGPRHGPRHQRAGHAQRRAVHPVRVLEREDHRPRAVAPAGLVQREVDRAHRGVTARLRVELHRALGRADLQKARPQRAVEGRVLELSPVEPGHEVVGEVDAQQPAQGLPGGVVGDAREVRVGARDHEPTAARARVGAEHLEQPRAARALFAHHRERHEAALRGARQPELHLAQGLFALQHRQGGEVRRRRGAVERAGRAGRLGLHGVAAVAAEARAQGDPLPTRGARGEPRGAGLGVRGDAQRLGEIDGGLKARVGVLGERAEQGVDEAGGELGDVDPRVWRRGVHVQVEDVVGVLGLEGEPARHALVEHHGGGVEVRAGVWGEAPRLLRGHVVGRAADETRGGHPGGLVPADLREAEVHDLHEVPAGGEGLHEDVLGLDVPVHDAELVGLVERGEHLPQDLRGARDRESPQLPHHVREVAPAEELHHQVQQLVVGAPEVEHHHRVGVVDLRAGLSLLVEALDGVAVAREVGGE
jgi:hypothetical protein